MGSNCEDSEYSEFIQNNMNVESTTDNLNRLAEEDGTPDENKEFEDLEGIEQNIYPDDDEPLRIHNTDSETDAVKVEIDKEHQHLYELMQKQDQISSESEELFRDKQKDPRMYCIGCGKVSTPLLCLSCRTKTIHARIEQRLNSP